VGETKTKYGNISRQAEENVNQQTVLSGLEHAQLQTFLIPQQSWMKAAAHKSKTPSHQSLFPKKFQKLLELVL